jgi:hypothetical protein
MKCYVERAFPMLIDACIVIVAIATTIIMIRSILSKAKPSIVAAEIIWPVLTERHLAGEVTVANKGARACNIVNIQVEAEGLNARPTPISAKYDLPRPVSSHERKRVRFGCDLEAAQDLKVDMNNMPKKAAVHVRFDCRKKPITRFLKPVANFKLQYPKT